MVDPVIPRKTLEAVARSICVADGHDPDEGRFGRWQNHVDEARAAILAYHADMARRGLKVVARPRFTNAAAGIAQTWWDAAESVL